MANIYMTRKNSDPVPQYPLPAGFEIRPLPADGMGIWQRVMLDTGFTHQDVEGAFERDFARHGKWAQSDCGVIRFALCDW
jgi:hypothetical protein